MNVISFDGTGEIAPEPDWPSLYSDELEIAAAREHWRTITTDLRDRSILAPTNGHAIKRLIGAYLAFDRALREVAENGAVLKPRRGNAKAIARLSPHFSAMREASSDAAREEAQLGISPKDRGKVTKVERAKKAERAADRFLKRPSAG